MPESRNIPQAWHGIGASAGTATGPAYPMGRPPQLPAPTIVSDVEAELAKALAALDRVAAELKQRAAGNAIIDALAMMVDDPLLRAGVEERVRAGADAPHALDAAFATHREALLAVGGYIAERAADLDDLRNRAVAACLGLPMPAVPMPGRAFVLVAHDLAPVDTAELDPEQVLAIVTEAGGPTSHTAILARALGIPAVVNCSGALAIEDGTYITVDGDAGRVEPSAVDRVVSWSVNLDVVGPGRTADGYPIEILGNAGALRDLERLEHAEGIGLFRTEMLYLGRRDAPDRDEQIALYTKVFEKMAGRKVIVRTLDAGADKPLPFLGQGEEPNPALGIRGLRVARAQPEVLTVQLGAIAAAARATSAHVWVMAPMVATAAEADMFAARCHEAGLATAGVMVEVPAAALQAQALLRAVDFLSIGTNDLSQYTFAADRENGDLADLLDPWQPALLQLIAGCAAAGKVAGKPVGVCGEAASDPALAVVLVGLGVTSLSMPANAIPAVHAALAANTMEQCQRQASAALASRG